MRPRNSLLLLSLLFVCLALRAQSHQQKPAATCATCHEEQALPQPATPMAHAMELPSHNDVLAAHPSLTYRKDGYSYSVVTKNGRSTYVVSDGTKTVSIPIVWAMGAQAQTWVLERNGNLYESRVSYYPSIHALEITTGDEHMTPKNIEEAIGRPIGMDEAKACFNCHSTNALHDHQLDLKAVHPGLACERCHLGAQAHAAGMLSGSASAPIPPSLGKLQSEDISNFCGQCHRSWETVVRAHWKARPTFASSLIVWPTADASTAPIPASVASPVTIRIRMLSGIFLTTMRNVWPAIVRPQQPPQYRRIRKPARLRSRDAQAAICHRNRYRMAFCVSRIIRSAS